MTLTRPFSALVAMLIGVAGSDAKGQSVSVPNPAPTVLGAMAGSSLTIRGSTTVGAHWHCSARDIVSKVALAERSSKDSSTLPDVRGVTVHLPVSALRCQSAGMERAMRHALKADSDTAALAITGRFEITDDVQPTNPNERLLAGGLRVAGTERNVQLRARIELQPDRSLRVQSVIPLLLSTFGIERPKVLWGAVRARDAITVEVDLRYPRRSPTVASSGY